METVWTGSTAAAVATATGSACVSGGTVALSTDGSSVFGPSCSASTLRYTRTIYSGLSKVTLSSTMAIQL